MRPGAIRRGATVAAALAAGFMTFVAIQVVYLRTLGGVPILHGVPTPGGAPLEVHLVNMALQGAWSALAYGAVLRLGLGRVRWTRVAALWALGLGVIAAAASLAVQGVISHGEGFWGCLLVYLVAGLAVRDWAGRPAAVG